MLTRVWGFWAVLLAVGSLGGLWAQDAVPRSRGPVRQYDLKLWVDPVKLWLRGQAELELEPGVKDRLNLSLRALRVTKAEAVDPGGARPLEAAHNGDELVLHLPEGCQRVRIAYEGRPPEPDRFGGVYFKDGYAYNLGVLIGNEYPSVGKLWFPCVDSFAAKARYRITVFVPLGHMGVANGLPDGLDSSYMVATPPMLGYRYRLDQPIPSYLACFAAGNYVVLTDTLTQPGLSANPPANDAPVRVPVRRCVRPADAAAARNSFGHLQRVFNAFVQRWGLYRWPLVGYVSVGMDGGAMEHATAIAYPHVAMNGEEADDELWVHELSHSWFGNMVTAASPENMWLNEGFARYCEGLFAEALFGADSAQRWRVALEARTVDAAHRRDGWLPVYPLPLAATYSATTYNRGGLMVNNLRQYLGDSLFFDGLRHYLRRYAFSTASVPQLEDLLSNRPNALAPNAGQRRGFFNDWVYRPGWHSLNLRAHRSRKLTTWLVDLELEQQVLGRTDAPRHFALDVLLLDSTGTRMEEQHLVVDSTAKRLPNGRLLLRTQAGFAPALVLADPHNRWADADQSRAQMLQQGTNTLRAPEWGASLKGTWSRPGHAQLVLHRLAPPDVPDSLGQAFPMYLSLHLWPVKGSRAQLDWDPQALGADAWAREQGSSMGDLRLAFRAPNRSSWTVLPPGSQLGRNRDAGVLPGDYAWLLPPRP